ncbi:cutinase family protein [Candidatus Saccharibacteria bacterium]|nr:cutinase family protein [Candidatus Saccharibacteria bacterium]
MQRFISAEMKDGRRWMSKISFFAIVFLAVLGALLWQKPTQAADCPDVRVVFARGSGGERWVDKNYLAFKDSIESKLKTTDIDYEFVDLDYPAVGIGMDAFSLTVGAFFGAGDTYEFGRSVDAGVQELANLTSDRICQNTKYILGGYSQGAMTVSKALRDIAAERIIYAATFGDPKIYLPEGKSWGAIPFGSNSEKNFMQTGTIPAACRNENLSEYRMYVPDCYAYEGLLGSYRPYQPLSYAGKVGTWCNKGDIFCSSRFSTSDHTAYVSEGLYEDASRVIFDKICKAFGVKNTVSSPHDTAILIDSSGSMSGMIEQYKAEALRLAKKTLEAGGRVALFDYRDLDDPYEPVMHCDFNSCDLAIIRERLNMIHTEGGGDAPESLLSASFHVMKSLKWKQGSTKSLVVLTDADFLSPDRDGMTFDEVVSLSKKIDPVNFYIITNSESAKNYTALATATDGKVVSNFDELELLTDYIVERYDSLPKVEENTNPIELPELRLTGTQYLSEDTLRITFEVNMANTKDVLVILNDYLLGKTTPINGNGEITIGGLDRSITNVVALVPFGEEMRGVAATVKIEPLESQTESITKNVPKAPNTGKN